MRELNCNEIETVNGAGILEDIIMGGFGDAANAVVRALSFTGINLFHFGVGTLYTSYLVSKIVGAAITLDYDKADEYIKDFTDYLTPSTDFKDVK